MARNYTNQNLWHAASNFTKQNCARRVLARTAKFYAAKFHGVKFQEMKFQAPNLELKMKFNAAKFGGVKFRDGALLKFVAAKELRRSPSLCAVAPFKFTAPQNAKFYAAEFTAKGEKFCGMKRRGAGA